MIDQKAVGDFKRVYREEYWVEFGEEEVRRMAEEFLRFFKLIYLGNQD